MTQRSSPPDGDAAPAADRPAASALVVEPDRRRIDELARSWVRAVARTNFLPQGRTSGRALLAESLRELVAALAAEPFDAGAGQRIGAGLVANHMASPRALGDTIGLLSAQLLDDIGIDDPRGPARLAALLGQLATGYAEALRDRTLVAAEDLNRAERSAWRDQQRVLQRRLQHALLHDQLTGLPNRANLTRWLDGVLDTAGVEDRIGLCLLNVDRFRAINDSLGTEKADELLLAVANRLLPQATRHGHFLAHLGGDTFALAIERTTSSDDVVKAADRLLRALSDPVRLDGHQIPLSARVGVVERPAAGARSTELVRAADISVAWAQTDPHMRHGVGRLAEFDAGRNAVDVRRHTVTADMPAAMARGEFTLAYQPLVRLSDHALIGVEALARWRHPTLGPISPAQFIPAAEDTGLILPLGLALLEQACAQAVAWRLATGRTLSVSVNLAVAQLRDPSLVAAILRVLRDTGWPAEHLQLEITESAIIGTADTDVDAVDALHALAQQGIQLAIDDFGTGYSSLAYLAELPVHNLKLAATFLRDLHASTAAGRSNRTILPALVSLSHDLGLTVTAEGIETSEAVEHLRRLGCDVGQGYHLGRPMAEDAIAGLLVAPAASRVDH